MQTFRLQQCERPYNYQNCQRNKIWSDMGQVRLKKCFHRQSFTKYVRLTLVSMWNNALREKLNFCFSRVFWLSTRLSFYEV